MDFSVFSNSGVLAGSHWSSPVPPSHKAESGCHQQERRDTKGRESPCLRGHSEAQLELFRWPPGERTPPQPAQPVGLQLSAHRTTLPCPWTRGYQHPAPAQTVNHKLKQGTASLPHPPRGQHIYLPRLTVREATGNRDSRPLGQR